MDKSTMIAATALLALAACAEDTTTQDEDLVSGPGITEEFYAEAAAYDQFKIDSAQIARARSQDEDVVAFADLMIAEHEVSLANLHDSIVAAGLETTEVMLNDDQLADLQNLRDLSEEEFDEAFMAEQIEAHENAIDLHDNHGEEAEHEVIAAHASESVDRLSEHVERARSVVEDE